MKDLTGQIFGKLTVEEFAGYKVFPSGQRKTLWKCRCECGNEKVINYSSLINGYATSCGCYRKKFLSELKTEDLTLCKFGRLTPICKIGKNNRRSSLWLCSCECGKDVIVSAQNLKSGKVKSCGCLGSSNGEAECAIFLDEHYVTYSREYSFADLMGNRNQPLRFDFALFNSKNKLFCLIEYQGEQHFKEKKNGFGDRQKETDIIKRKYCEDNNINLYEIKYTDNIQEKLSSIISELSHEDTVPSC